MPRLVWLTDLHLNFATEEALSRLVAEVQTTNPAAILIGGDIGEANSFAGFLHHLDAYFNLPIYFVLGNHDYYGSSLLQVREQASQITKDKANLHWLPACGVISLDAQTALIGHGGWGDARAADFCQSQVVLNDYFHIAELRTAAAVPPNTRNWRGSPSAILNAGLESQLQKLGEETARHFQKVLPEALQTHEHVIVLMHVPPFREACWHEGKLSDDNWAPHFCCVAAGEVLVETMKQHPEKSLTVLCGHTHGEGVAEILPNLLVRTGKAEYGQPAIQCWIDTDSLD